MNQQLENKNIRLRAVEIKDIDTLYQWENNIDIWRISNTLTPFSRNIIERYVQNSHKDIYEIKQLRLMIETKKGQAAIGTIDLFNFDPFHQRAGIGILINNKDDRGKGYASEALSILIDYCFNILQLHQLYCNIESNNTPSINLFKKHGFTIIGLKKDWIKGFNKWEDEYLLQVINPNN